MRGPEPRNDEPSQAATVFVVSARGVAGPENSQPDGRRYDLLAFVRAETEDSARAAALACLGQLGWIEIEVLRAGEVTDPAAVPDDLRRTFERAQASGCAVIVYDEP